MGGSSILFSERLPHASDKPAWRLGCMHRSGGEEIAGMPASRAHAATKPMLGSSSRVLTLGLGICQATSTACLVSQSDSFDRKSECVVRQRDLTPAGTRAELAPSPVRCDPTPLDPRGAGRCRSRRDFVALRVDRQAERPRRPVTSPIEGVRGARRRAPDRREDPKPTATAAKTALGAVRIQPHHLSRRVQGKLAPSCPRRGGLRRT